MALSLAFLTRVFHLRDGQFRSMGLGDWMDPYFVNALLEHWYRVATGSGSPASPPMFFPAPHTLGYSHGLLLYAPFYVPLRALLHPFQAQTATLFAVIEAGAICLYCVLRRIGLSFGEALVLSAFFLSSQNVVNGTTAVWAQRASVFLIPPIVLMTMAAARLPRRASLAVAGIAGLLAGLMYVQDFYTAHFAALFALCFGAAASAGRLADVRPQAARFWRAQSRATRIIAAGVAALSILAAWILMYGGATARLLGVRLAARDWRRPAVAALVGVVVLMWRFRRHGETLRRLAAARWSAGFAVGAAAGAALFLWIYLPAFREHPGFPAEEVAKALVARDPYPTLRPFLLAGIVALLAWLPPFRTGAAARRYALWVVAVSAVVLIAPMRLGGFSIWTAFIGRLPGFSAIRDPKRIIYLYELALAIAAGTIVVRGTRVYRAAITIAAAALIVCFWNREVFDYERPNAPYDRWVAAPISIDASCRSFFVKGASREYMARSRDMGTLYGIDSAFIALNHGIPTLNGYSAWSPPGWELWNPHEATYEGRVRAWIRGHGLTGVCALDVDARTMLPFS